MTQTALRPPVVPARVAPGLTAGVAGQGVLLLLLAATVGVHASGWAAGVAVALVAVGLVGAGLRRAGAVRLGLANAVTLTRTVLVGGVTALTVDTVLDARPVPRVLVALTVVALVLDGVDGRVARRTGGVTRVGAVFDQEVDAFLMLVLSVLLVRPVGVWALGIGLMRYAFLVAGRVLPWFAAPLPPRYARKVVAAVEGVVLVVAVAGVLPAAVTTALVAAALALLTWSFGVDVAFLVRARLATLRAAASVL